MTDLERAIAATLRADAQEAAMTTDTPHEHRILESRLDVVDARRHRNRWLGAAAVAAAVIVAAVVGATVWPRESTPPPSTTPSPTPSTSTFRMETVLLTPNVTADLPAWVTTAGDVGAGNGYVVYDQKDCGPTPCPTDQQLKIRVYSVAQMYAPGSTRMTIAPSYATYVAAWDSVATSGKGLIREKSFTSVGGRPATLMTVSMSEDLPGLTSCQTTSDVPTDCFFPSRDRTYRLAIVDQGTGRPPTLLTESSNADPAGEALAAREFGAWIDTVRFTA